MLRVGWYAPCIGIGGADAYMLGIIKYAHNIQWTGVACGGHLTVRQWEWFKRMYPGPLKINQTDYPTKGRIEGPEFFESNPHNFYNIARDSDIMICWCMEDIEHCLKSLDIPIIELAQNEDAFAREIVDKNKDVKRYKVACSKSTAVKVFEGDVDQVIYNAVDPSRVTPRYGRKFARKAWGLEEDDKLLTFVGRFVDEKLPQALIQALTSLPEEWKGLFVGDGYRAKDLMDSSKRLVPGRVRIMEPQYDIGDILAATDVFILPSDFEGHPLTVCEAWLTHTPTVVSDMDVMVELRETYGPLASYVPKRPSTQELADAVIRAASDSEEVIDEVNRAAFVSWNEFTLTKAATVWEEFLYKVYNETRIKKMRPMVHLLDKDEPSESAKTWVTKVKNL